MFSRCFISYGLRKDCLLDDPPSADHLAEWSVTTWMQVKFSILNLRKCIIWIYYFIL